MDNSEKIYNQALEMLKAGNSMEEVLLKFADASKDLGPLLSLSNELLAMPKNLVPTPQMKRKYALAPTKNFWLTWIHVSKFAGVSVSLMLLITALIGLSYQTLKSSPGQTLFAFKKSAEQVRVMLASNQDKAGLQIEIAHKRLNEAQQIFNNPNSGIEEKKAALTELANQTSSAIAEVTTAAKNYPKSEKNPPLLDSLDSINHEQENLLAEIKPDNEIKNLASSALHTLSENTAKISEIKQSVAAADNEQVLVKLNPSATSTGAKILPDLAQPDIKGTSTPNLNALSGEATTTTGTLTTLKKPQNSSSTNSSLQNDPGTAVGSFLLEDPSPQFVP